MVAGIMDGDGEVVVRGGGECAAIAHMMGMVTAGRLAAAAACALGLCRSAVGMAVRQCDGQGERRAILGEGNG